MDRAESLGVALGAVRLERAVTRRDGAVHVDARSRDRNPVRRVHANVERAPRAAKAFADAGVSELHLDSVERFLDEVSRSSIGREAMEDEELFVDRARSHDFCSAVHWHP